MEREIETLRLIGEYLIQRGYPEESIIYEWPIWEMYRVDLAVIDPKTKRPLAIFEFKKHRRPGTDNDAIIQLRTHAKELGDKNISLYMVYSENEPPFFRFFRISNKKNDALEQVDQIPEFTYFRTINESRRLVTVEKAFWTFEYTCWGLSGMVSILFVLDILNWIDVTGERLWMIAAIISLIVIPYAKKLNILWVEFERITKE